MALNEYPMVDLKQYRENAATNNLCAEYTKIWDSCRNKKQLVDMACGAKGADYLCDTIAKGWGLDPDYIYGHFDRFINGNYVSNQNGYSSKLYCRFMGDIEANTTLLILIDTDANITLPKNSLCEIYCTGKCNIEVFGKGRAVFICYGNESDISITSEEENIKRINKKERDHYA